MTDLTKLTSIDRHLIPAYHAWLVENGFTPFIGVSYEHPDLDIPSHLKPHESAVVFSRSMGLVRLKSNYQILNISYDAADQLHFGEQGISFNARFNGRSFSLYVPYEAVLSIYAREESSIAHFPIREVELTQLEGGTMAELKFGSNAPTAETAHPATARPDPFRLVESKTGTETAKSDPDAPTPTPSTTPRRRGHLSVVK